MTLCAPAVWNEADTEAVPPAAAPLPVRTAGVPATAAVPSVAVPALNVTVPVGATPLLPVAIVAVNVTGWPIGTVEALLTTVDVVGAAVIVIAAAGEVLALKLLSPE